MGRSPRVGLVCVLFGISVLGCGPDAPTGFSHVTPLRPAAAHTDDEAATGAAFLLHGGEARRGWQTAPGERATLQFTATAGARFEIAAARTDEAPVRARASISIANTNEPETAILDEAIESEPWQEMGLDLAAFAGRDVTLSLWAERVGGGPAAIDWGEPILLERRDGPRPPNIVLITLDTTRADVASDPQIAPHLARLAERGIAFRDAWSAATSTTPSHASILTGLPVERHGATTNRSVLASGLDTLAEQLAARGYQTAASVTVHHIGYEAGFGQGFGRFRPAAPGDSLDGAASVESVLGWIDAWAVEGDRPFFLWVHLFDPHTPYGPPRKFIEGELARRGIVLPSRRGDPPSVPIFPGALPTPLAWLDGITNRAHVDALYRAGVAYADLLAGRLIDRLDALGLSESTVFVVTADHGEALGEQGVFYQHAGLWPASLRVPLVVAGPDWPSGGTSDARVGGIDILPSLLAAAEGRSQSAPLLDESRDRDPGRRVWFAEAGLGQLGFRDGDVHYAQALAAGQYGVLLDERADGPHVRAIQRYPAGAAWLFDLRSDPMLEHDLAGDPGAGVERYRSLVIERAHAGTEQSRLRSISESEAAALRALGYAEDPEPDRE